jgi:hypothetical protein
MTLGQHWFSSLRVLAASLPFWSSIVALFLIVHVTRDVIARFVPPTNVAVFFYVPSLKGMLFFVSLCIVIQPVVRDVRRIAATLDENAMRSAVIVAIGVTLLLTTLVFQLGTESMGRDYADRSVSPFEQDTGWYNKRLLMPAIAHILFFRGNWLYYVLCSFVFIVFLVVLYSWLRNYTSLKPWQFLSLSTCSFVIFQQQFPGYPDVLIFTFFVLLMYPEFTQKSKLCFLILALVTHEASFFIGPILAYRYLHREGRLQYLLALILYGTIWWIAYDFSIQAMFGNHNKVLGMSGIEWLLQFPARWSLGVLIGFKAVWALLLVGIVLAIQRHLYRDAIFIGGCVCTTLVVTTMSVDTSRFIGLAFPGALVALQTIRQQMQGHIADRTFSLVFAANMVIPSFYVGLNTGIVLRPGLYKQLYSIWPL